MDDRLHLIYFADPMCSWCYGFSPVICPVQERSLKHLAGIRTGHKASIAVVIEDIAGLDEIGGIEAFGKP